ncbi:MAG: family 10 glycosylhydrolase [Candidatus Obscuribacterales bacterium]|jgi:uncharacterized lipoprotein YddW (UPF0748 family)|nr:family 10 glycosylhydrolase [Candidatus Obscuribacterales bacterium]
MLENRREDKLNGADVEPQIIAFHEQLAEEQRLYNLRESTKDALHLARRSGSLSASEVKELKSDLKSANALFKEYERIKRNGEPSISQGIGNLRAQKAYETLAERIIEGSEENRAIWLDRKDIVSSGPEELSKKILALKKAGITTIYIECDNGGYALYDSKLLKKNPDLEKWSTWDPLREAIDTAHANNMKVEAWTKVFAVCNRALDEQFKTNYPNRKFPPAGPVLEEHNQATPDNPYGDWALRMYDGRLPERTHDVFLDPANPQASKFAQDMLLEIAERYPDIDGIQYDYIRYPFHNEGMGLNHNNWKQFQAIYPQYKNTALPSLPSEIRGQMLRDWNEWKNKQIDDFVLDTSNKMRALNPKLDVSAAVYPCDLNDTVRQQWSRWIKNGSVDTLNPMTYVPHDVTSRDAEFTPAFERKFKSDIKEIRHESNDKGVLLPGIMVSRVNPKGMMREIEIVRELKLPGETLFATSVLDSRRLRELELDQARRAFKDFENLSRIALKSIANEPKMQMEFKQYEQEVQVAAKSIELLAKQEPGGKIRPDFRRLPNTDSNRGSAIERVRSVKNKLDGLLDQHPISKSAWTKRMSQLLTQSVESL